MSVADFEELWTSKKHDYVLLRSIERPGNYVICNAATQMMELIEDDGVNAAVAVRMIEAGVAVVDRLPGS